jgi:hypothetical protein
MLKTDYEINCEVGNFIKDNFDFVTDVYVHKDEDMKHFDLEYTASTKSNKLKEYQMEVKSIKFKTLKDDEGNFNRYFTNDIYGKLLFGNTPDDDYNTNNLPKYWNEEPIYKSPPIDMREGKPIYILNASDLNGNIHNSKWHYITNNKYSFSYVSSDGILLFNPKQLEDAFIGYAWYKNSSHTTEIKNYYNKGPVWELKALIDLSKGSYYKHNFNKNLFRKYDKM